MRFPSLSPAPPRSARPFLAAILFVAAPGVIGSQSATTRFRAAQPDEFDGQWEAVSEDQTSAEVVVLRVAGRQIQGTITKLSRGYFSGRVTTDYELEVTGVHRNGAFDVHLRDPQDGWNADRVLRLRGEFLILVGGARELAAYARAGRPIVQSAEGSAEAAALARSILGRIYSASQQASGRGAFVGGRLRIAFCADGAISYTASDLVSTPGAVPGGGVDGGSSISRRGRWSIVLRAGAPAVRADWEGTGTSYSLVAYFRVSPSPDGRRAVIDGSDVPMTGTC